MTHNCSKPSFHGWFRRLSARASIRHQLASKNVKVNLRTHLRSSDVQLLQSRGLRVLISGGHLEARVRSSSAQRALGVDRSRADTHSEPARSAVPAIHLSIRTLSPVPRSTRASSGGFSSRTYPRLSSDSLWNDSVVGRMKPTPIWRTTVSWANTAPASGCSLFRERSWFFAWPVGYGTSVCGGRIKHPGET